jgi:hypothetical protein
VITQGLKAGFSSPKTTIGLPNSKHTEIVGPAARELGNRLTNGIDDISGPRTEELDIESAGFGAQRSLLGGPGPRSGRSPRLEWRTCH